MFMCFFIYFIVYWSYSNFIYELMFLMYLVINFFFISLTFIMYLQCHRFMGVNTSTRKYDDIACRSRK